MLRILAVAVAMAMNNLLRIFQIFMARVIALKDMAKLSSHMLAVFQLELGMFCRSPPENSSMVTQVLASESSKRLDIVIVTPIMLGWSSNRQWTMHLSVFRTTCSKEDLSARLSNVALAEGAKSSETGQDIGQEVSFAQRADIGQVSSPKIEVRQLFTPDYVTTMIANYGMLQQDLTMKERVVVTLGLDLSPKLLQNYQIMWTFMDESVVEEALSSRLKRLRIHVRLQ